MNPTAAVRSVDLNADLGEGYGPWTMGDDDAILPIVSSANVACGLHAGDPHIMARTFARAKALGVAVGAHPGYPDRWGFGRRAMVFSAAEIEHLMAYQLGAAMGLSTYAGHPITYVKPHGALSNLSQVDEGVAGAIVRAIVAVDRRLTLLTYPDGQPMRLAQEAGLRTCAEVFADRAYLPSGQLVPRQQAGAVLHDADAVGERVVRMVRDGAVECIDGSKLPLEIGSICVHGDSPGAITMATAVRRSLGEAGIEVRAFA